jgi:hypothetical protein
MGECVGVATSRAQAVTFFPMGYKGCEPFPRTHSPRLVSNDYVSASVWLGWSGK